MSNETLKWHEENGVIRCSVSSLGMMGEVWVKRLEAQGFSLNEKAMELLLSKEFKTTQKIVDVEMVILRGELFSDENRITGKIRAEATSRKLLEPSPEVACRLREQLTDGVLEGMGLSRIIVMHNPIPHLLSMGLRTDDRHWLEVEYGEPDGKWGRKNGFAFAAAKV